jgi:hypothetical protein
MDGIDGGILDAMGQLQKLSAVDPVPMMKAKKNPPIASAGGRYGSNLNYVTRLLCNPPIRGEGPSSLSRAKNFTFVYSQ